MHEGLGRDGTSTPRSDRSRWMVSTPIRLTNALNPRWTDSEVANLLSLTLKYVPATVVADIIGQRCDLVPNPPREVR